MVNCDEWDFFPINSSSPSITSSSSDCEITTEGTESKCKCYMWTNRKQLQTFTVSLAILL